MNSLLTGCICLLLLALATTASAQTVPLSYQGQLLNNGQPWTGTVDLEFELFFDEDGTYSLGVYSSPNHPINNGLFQAQLSFELDPSATDRGMPEVEMPTLYLEITVDGQKLSPLQLVTPVPWALSSAFAMWALEADHAQTSGHAQTADHALTASAPWEISGNDLLYMDGRVGIGRAPDDYFVVDSGLEQQDDNYGFGTGALRVMVREPGSGVGLTKLRVLGNGGVAVGNSYNNSGVPIDGLRVHGDTRLSSDLEVGGFSRFDGISQFHDQSSFHNIAFFQASGIAANFVNGAVILQQLGSSGTTTLCRNGDNFISTCSSSARYKDHIADLDQAGDLIGKLRAVSFRWIDSGREDIGLIAEEVAEIEPRLATYNDEGTVEGVNYRHLAAVLVAAFQEQQTATTAMQAAHQAEIAALRAELEAERQSTAERLAMLELLLSGEQRLAGGQP